MLAVRRVSKAAPVAVVFVLVVAVVAFNHRELRPMGRTLADADLPWLGLGILLMFAWSVAWMGTYVASRRAVGLRANDVSPHFWRVVMAALAANSSVKSGGLAAVGVFAADSNARGVSRGQTHASVVLTTTIVDLAFVFTLVAGMVAIVVDDVLTRTESIAASTVVVALIAKSAAVVVAAGRRDLLRRLYSVGPALTSRLRRAPNRSTDDSAADEVYDAFAAIRRRPVSVLPALAWATCIDLIGVGILWASIAAVGGGDSLTTALIVYTVSALFGMVSVLPGGIGFVEVGATAVLVNFGVPVATAAAAILVFRLLEFWLPLLMGGVGGMHLAGSRKAVAQ